MFDADDIRRAYIAGATDVHNNWQEDRDPDFKEAASDYVATMQSARTPTSRTMDEGGLEPCPFCGGEQVAVSDNERGLMFNVHCGKCRTRGPWERCASDAAHAWNTRASPPPCAGDDVERITSALIANLALPVDTLIELRASGNLSETARAIAALGTTPLIAGQEKLDG